MFEGMLQERFTENAAPVVILPHIPCCRMADNLPVVGGLCEHGVCPEAFSHVVEANGDEKSLSGLEYFQCIPVLKQTTSPLVISSAWSLFSNVDLKQCS